MSPDPERWLLVSDVDDTLLGDDEALVKLTAALQAVRARLVLAYNSSRPCASLRRSLLEHPLLPQPDYLIGALGTEIEQGKDGPAFEACTRRLAAEWRRETIAALMERLGFEAHADEFQTPLKASYHVPGDDQHQYVLEQLDHRGVRVKVIFSGGKNLDIIPFGAGKGNAADYLRNMLDFSPERVVVAGDSGNDREMFILPFKGIVVANAATELKALSDWRIYHAQASHAAGVLEGLQHWGVLES
ncbi:MAG: HAD-IIB family hydrolase [Anaerolineales bacterium]